MLKKDESHTGKLAVIVHGLIRMNGPYQSLGELADDVKTSAARYRLPYDAGLVTAAIALVARSRKVTR